MAMVPIGPFVRFLLAGSAAVYQNWDTLTGLFDRKQELTGTPVFGMYVQHVFEFKDASGAFSSKERGLCGVHWINSTGGDLDVTWTSADYALVETGFQTLWTNIVAQISNDCRLVEHRWYQFGPGVIPPNPPVRVTAVTPMVGSSTSIVPHQLASTVTFRTPLRRHWGRIYLPVILPLASQTAGGQIATSTVDTIANAATTYVKSGTANGLTPVIYDRLRHGMLGITAVEVDSVPDIQRRRRPRNTLYKKINTS